MSEDALHHTYAEVCKVGPSIALDLLIRGPEPDLAGFLKCRATALQKQLLSSGGGSTDPLEAILAIATTAIAVLRKAHYRLWLDSAIGTRLAHLDPTLVDDPPSGG